MQLFNVYIRIENRPEEFLHICPQFDCFVDEFSTPNSMLHGWVKPFGTQLWLTMPEKNSHFQNEPPTTTVPRSCVFCSTTLYINIYLTIFLVLFGCSSSI